MKSKIKTILIALTILTTITGATFYFWFWKPMMKIQNVDWFYNAPVKERREVAHQVLNLPYGNFHDAYLILKDIGNHESIPILLKHLKKFPKDGDFRPCSQVHCLDALQKITGQEIGYDYEKWQLELNKKQLTM